MNLKNDLEKYFYCTPSEVLANFFLYALISEILFFSITKGWALLVNVVLYLWIFPVLLCLLGSIFYSARYGSYINQKLFSILAILIFIFQILAILFNQSDCGDWGRTFYFIETIIYNTDLVCTEPALFREWGPIYSLSFRCIYYLLNFILVLLFIYGQRLSIEIEEKQKLQKARQEIKDLAPIFTRAIQQTGLKGLAIDNSPASYPHSKDLYFENKYYIITVTNNPKNICDLSPTEELSMGYSCSNLTIERKQPTGNKIILSLNFKADFETRPGLNNVCILENYLSKNDRILLQFADSING